MARYSNEKHISRSRFSNVFQARDDTGRSVALKVTTPAEDKPPHCSRDELRILKLLSSEDCPHIVHLIDSFERDLEDLVMVFPYYPHTLTDLLRHNATQQGSRYNPYAAISVSSMSRTSSEESNSPQLSPRSRQWKSHLRPEAGCSIVKGLASGLAFLHEKGIIHRDIKPANIMFQDYDPQRPIIIDLGISYQYPDNFGKEQPDHKICDIATSIYRAPELLFHLTNYSYGVDIWALGIVMTLIFSENVKPALDAEDAVDFKVMHMIFESFGTPTLETWPEAKESRTFSNLQLESSDSKPVESLLPRAPTYIQEIFKDMMVFESSKRLSSLDILTRIQQHGG